MIYAPLHRLASLCAPAWLVFTTSATIASAAELSPLRIDDLYCADSVLDLTVLPGGQSAVYCRQWAEARTRTMRQTLWCVKDKPDNRQPLEVDEPDGARPQLSPDGKWIVFLSTRPFPDGTPAFQPVPPYSDPAVDIWLIPAAGGRAIPLGGKSKPYGRVITDTFYARVAFSPDGRRLVFVADDGRDPRTREEIQNNVIVARDDQGEGYEGYGPMQIWVADLSEKPAEVAAARITRVTHDSFWYGDPQWAPDGTFLVVHANRTSDQESVRYSINHNYDLWKIHLKDHRLTQLTTGPGPEVSPRISPDGRRIVCLSSPRRGPHADVFNLLVLELGSAGVTSTVLFDHHGPVAQALPHLPPNFPLPADCWRDEHRFVFNALNGLKSQSQMIDLRMGANAQEISPPSAEQQRQAEARRRLSPPSNTYVRERLRARDEIVRWKSFDGLEIDGVLTLPPPEVAQKPFKLLLHPHGGPHSRASSGGGFDVQIFAMHGYAVFQPNFRGTAGYGRKFLDADRFDLGGGDMRDMLSGIEYLVEQGIADRHRQFVYGVSYGGFTTSWLVGQTTQFRAAVAQNAVTDMNVMWHLSDLQSWTEWELGGLPWEVPESMRAHSPLTYAPRVRTPTLILHSANDRRCPVPMGRMFHQALKRNGVDTGLVIYPDEGHPIKQLPHREDVLRRVLDWFARHDVSAGK